MEPYVALDDAAFLVRGQAPAEYANTSGELHVQDAAPEAPSVQNCGPGALRLTTYIDTQTLPSNLLHYMSFLLVWQW